jgi:hypothetical protein
MKGDYIELKGLQSSRAYKLLQALWVQQGADILKAQSKAAKKGQESSWRFYAGQAEGFAIAINQLDSALLAMEHEGEGDQINSADEVAKLFDEIKLKQGEQQ